MLSKEKMKLMCLPWDNTPPLYILVFDFFLLISIFICFGCGTRSLLQDLQLCHMCCVICVVFPNQELNQSLASGVQSLSQWTSKKVPPLHFILNYFSKMRTF